MKEEISKNPPLYPGHKNNPYFFNYTLSSNIGIYCNENLEEIYTIFLKRLKLSSNLQDLKLQKKYIMLQNQKFSQIIIMFQNQKFFQIIIMFLILHLILLIIRFQILLLNLFLYLLIIILKLFLLKKQVRFQRE